MILKRILAPPQLRKKITTSIRSCLDFQIFVNNFFKSRSKSTSIAEDISPKEKTFHPSDLNAAEAASANNTLWESDDNKMTFYFASCSKLPKLII